MQIHELNNFTGTLGSGAYLAIDDGTDTGKISSQGLLAATEARIDNIIAGPAPTAEEIVDARLGADGVTYPSLGDAIRDQVSDLKSNLTKHSNIITDNLMGIDVQQNLYEGSADWSGVWINSDPINMTITDDTYQGYAVAHSAESWRRIYKEIPVVAGKTYTFQATIKQAVAGTIFLYITRADTTSPATISQSMFQFNNQPANTWITLSGTFTVSASGNVSPYALSNGGAFSLAKYTLVEGKKVFSLTDALNEKADASIEEKTDTITLHKNILEDLTVTEGKVYERLTANAVDNEYCNIYPPINITSGTTYYFHNIYAYFCVIKYSDNTVVNLSDDTSTVLSGSFTASKNGTIYISVRNSRSGFVFTESEVLYNSGLTESFATIDVQNIPKIYHVEKDGSGDFDSLVDAIDEATKYMDSKVYVGAGTWDLISELGSDYIDSVGSSKRGVYLKNRVHLIFNPKAVVECIYEGSRADTIAWLSAFNAGAHGFTLENANIKTGNIRYCVHDERDQDADFYTNIYKNCIMYHDSSYAQGGQNQCIGGGLGLNGHIVVDGCVFENPNVNNSSILSWHNSAGSNAKSVVDVHGCYVKGTNTMRFRYYGSTPSTQKSTILCHDNSLGAAVVYGAETSESTNENIELLAWNNVVRS